MLTKRGERSSLPGQRVAALGNAAKSPALRRVTVRGGRRRELPSRLEERGGGGNLRVLSEWKARCEAVNDRIGDREVVEGNGRSDHRRHEPRIPPWCTVAVCGGELCQLSPGAVGLEE